jgi:hypothetical protein
MLFRTLHLFTFLSKVLPFYILVHVWQQSISIP